MPTRMTRVTTSGIRRRRPGTSAAGSAITSDSYQRVTSTTTEVLTYLVRLSRPPWGMRKSALVASNAENRRNNSQKHMKKIPYKSLTHKGLSFHQF